MPRRALGPPPRSWLRAPKAGRSNAFGVQDLDDNAWKTPKDDAGRAAVAAAKEHHRVAQALRSLILRSGKSIAEVAKEIGMSEDGLYRTLNGSQHLSLTDLVRIAHSCGRDVRVAFTKPRDEG